MRQLIRVAVLVFVAMEAACVPMNMAIVEKFIDEKISEAVKQLIPKSCRNVGLDIAALLRQTDVYDSFLSPELGLTEVEGDATISDGNWTVFQRRTDGSVDFYRNWNDYVSGFGNARGEFWLGLEAIHQLTKSNDQELEINMVEEDGTHYQAKYSTFKVGPASDNYRMRVSGYSGNATDTLTIHNNQEFTTRDVDHDAWLLGNCGTSNKGAWWYYRCGDANLNGRYNDNSVWTGVVWYHWGKGQVLHMSYTEMKFREKQ